MEGSIDDEAFEAFAKRLSYLPADATDEAAYRRLAEFLGSSRHPLYYLATPPSLFAPIVESLGRAGLAGHARVVVEKPFGHDLASARDLNARLLEVLDDDQIADRPLPREGAGPGPDLPRFANELFEARVEPSHVEAVQLNLAESFGIEAAAASTTTSARCWSSCRKSSRCSPRRDGTAGGRSRRDRPPPDGRPARDPDADPADYVRGQYEGYGDEDGVKPGSETETFAALKLGIDNWRWSGVPFLIRAAKAMPTTLTEVDARFRRPPPILMGTLTAEVKHHNHVSIRIGADASASIGVLVKDATSDSAEPVHLDVSFREHVQEMRPYERLLGDALTGTRCCSRASGWSKSCGGSSSRCWTTRRTPSRTPAARGGRGRRTARRAVRRLALPGRGRLTPQTASACPRGERRANGG